MLRIKRKVRQVSPIRSGSTLIANLLRGIFPESEVAISKRHSISEHIPSKLDLYVYRRPFVCTCRYPLDVLASHLIRYDREPTKEMIEAAITKFESTGGNDLKMVLNRPNVLLMKYEDFYGDFEYIFDSFEDFFKIQIEREKRNKLTEEFSIASVEKKVESLSSPDQFDEKTSFRGKHISKFKGMPGHYRYFFTEDQMLWLRDHFAGFIEDFGYIGTEIADIHADPVNNSV